MGYVDSNLVPGERVLYRAHPHWITYLGAILIFMLFTLAAWGLRQASPDMPRELAFFLFIIGTIPLIAAYLRYRCSEYAVTDKRVLIKSGILTRHTMETLLTRVENISVEQGLLGRILDFGTIQVTGTGATKETFPNIAAPLEFRKQVQAATIHYEDRKNIPQSVQGRNRERNDREERECPFCAERILKEAKICRFCGREVPAVTPK